MIEVAGSPRGIVRGPVDPYAAVKYVGLLVLALAVSASWTLLLPPLESSIGGTAPLHRLSVFPHTSRTGVAPLLHGGDARANRSSRAFAFAPDAHRPFDASPEKAKEFPFG